MLNLALLDVGSGYLPSGIEVPEASQGPSLATLGLGVILALIDSQTALAPLRGPSGAILIAGVLVTLVVTLGREVVRAENKKQG